MLVDNGERQFEYSGWTTTSRMWLQHLPTMIKGYALVAGQPAWSSMRHMELHPTDAPLPDGSIMAGNVFTKNIVAWTNPEASLARYNHVSPPQNITDSNLYWHAGLPMKTGMHQVGHDLAEVAIPNPTFEPAQQGVLPKDWRWHTKPKDAAATIVEGPSAGEHAVRMSAAFDETKPRDNYPIIMSQEFPLTPGKSYRLHGKFRSTQAEAKAGLMIESYMDKAYFWASNPSSAKVGPTWQDADFVFTVPAPGEKNFHPEMKAFRVRIDWAEKAGSVDVADLSLHEVTMLDEWESWRALGYDTKSVVADPLFQDWAKDDYRLKSDSPAAKIGFKPIPVEEIGPYASELRASWPIVEAEGAREKPLTTRR